MMRHNAEVWMGAVRAVRCAPSAPAPLLRERGARAERGRGEGLGRGGHAGPPLLVFAFLLSAVCASASDEVARLADRDVSPGVQWSVSFHGPAPSAEMGHARIEDGRLVIVGDHQADSRLRVGQAFVPAPRPLPLGEFPYLTVRIRGDGKGWYYIRPRGLAADGKPCELWHELAATDDRQGSDWETATFNLRELARECGTGAVALAGVAFACATVDGSDGRVEVEFLCVHSGLVPSPKQPKETDFRNSLDDDGNGRTDADDDGFATARPGWVLAYYHPWFGTPTGPTATWLGWKGKRAVYGDMLTVPQLDPDAEWHDPEVVVPGTAGKQDIAAPYYPLAYWSHPDYRPGAALDYGATGGVDRYDCRDVEFVMDQIRCAKRFGIDGFIVDMGGIGSFDDQLATVVEAARRVGDFNVSAVYDWYYYNPSFTLMEAKSPEAMARDLFYLRHRFGSQSSWLRSGGKPVIFASFMSSSGVSLDHWRKAVALSAGAQAPADGRLLAVAGRAVDVLLRFERSFEGVNNDTRPLLAAFERVSYLDGEFREIGALDIGTATARSALLSGWSFDEAGGPDGTFAWAASDDLEARLRLEVPEGTAYVNLRGPGFVQDPLMYEVVVRGRVHGIGRKGAGSREHSCLLAVGPAPPALHTTDDDRDYALLLDTRQYAAAFDGCASYGESAIAAGCEVSSGLRLVGATALPGYNDTVIRNPGNVVSRDGGLRFRESFERALATRPGFLQICTWSEWGEGTVIEPTVEFGYTYCEIALTYSLIYRGLLKVYGVPSRSELTVERYEPGRRVEISCTRPIGVGFAELRARWLVTDSDGTRPVRATGAGLSLRLKPGWTSLVRGGDDVRSGH